MFNISKKIWSINMKRYSTSLVIKEMYSETTVTYHFTQTRMAIIFYENDKIWWGHGKFGTISAIQLSSILYILVGM